MNLDKFNCKTLRYYSYKVVDFNYEEGHFIYISVKLNIGSMRIKIV